MWCLRVKFEGKQLLGKYRSLSGKLLPPRLLSKILSIEVQRIMHFIYRLFGVAVKHYPEH